MIVANAIEARIDPPKTSLIVMLGYFTYWSSKTVHSKRLVPRNAQENIEETSMGCRRRERRAGSFLLEE